MSAELKDKLARAWADDLQSRLPESHPVYPMRRDATAKPPYSVVTVMRMDQQYPGSGVWLADVKMVCVCDIAQGGSTEQELRLEELSKAVEETVAGDDYQVGVRLYGFTVDEVRTAKAEKVYSDILFVTAGCGPVVG